jgi:hypothetical protein
MKKAVLAISALAIACALIPLISAADVPSVNQAGNTHAPPTINNLNATRGGPGKITLNWTMQGHGGYTIQSVTVHRYVGSPQGTALHGTAIHLGAVQHWSDTNAQPGVMYGYQVCAKDTGGEIGCAVAKYELPQ